MVKKRSNPWPKLFEEIYNRLLNSFKSLHFLVGFFVGLIFFGGMGVWMPYFIGGVEGKVFWESQSLFTFGMAILGAIFIDFSLAGKPSSDITSVGILVSIAAVFLCVWGYVHTQTGFSCMTLSGACIAVLLFVFVNVNDPKYDNDVDKDSVATATGFNETNVDLITDK